MNIATDKEPLKQKFWFLYRLLARVRMLVSPETIHVGPSGERYHINQYSYVERMIKQGDFETKRAVWLHDHVGTEDVFVDIGANIGFFTVIAAKCGATVHAFEPDTMNYHRLSRNLKLNNFDDARVKTYPCALGSAAGFAVLHRSLTDNYGRASLGAENTPDGHRVEVRRLDDILTSFGPRHVLKVDVEGAEVMVLDGALGTLEHLRVGSIWLVEVHVTFGVELAAVVERFTRFGYRVSFLDDATGTVMSHAPEGCDVLLMAERV